MYQALLTRRYLTSKIMPLLAALAVVLCVAMVLVVWSVMGGFLDTLLASGRNLMGDVSVSWPVVGFGHYDELVEDLEKDPMVKGAAPTLETIGLLRLPDSSTFQVTVMGVDGKSFDRVTDYASNLWWKPKDAPLPDDRQWEDERLWDPPPTITRDEQRLQSPDMRNRWRTQLQSLYEQGQALTGPAPGTSASGTTASSGAPTDANGEPGMVLGIELGQLNERDKAGYFRPMYRRVGRLTATLTVIPTSKAAAVVDVQARKFPVVNNIQTGLYDADSRWTLVRLDALQEMLKMNEAERVDAGAGGGSSAPGFGVRVDANGRETFATPAVVARDPARVTSVLVRAADGVSSKALLARVREIYAEFAKKHDDVPEAGRAMIRTWDQRPGIATFVAAVRKEISLVLFLFGFISLTAVFLVFAIFWSMVSEKTKDVGVLRAVGATRAGVAWLFVRYGVAIGVVGSLGGGALALLVIRNINEIHKWISDVTGQEIWVPTTYQFNRIPSEVNPLHAAIVLLAGVLFSVLGALAPAIKAARLDPVEALRFE